MSSAYNAARRLAPQTTYASTFTLLVGTWGGIIDVVCKVAMLQGQSGTPLNVGDNCGSIHNDSVFSSSLCRCPTSEVDPAMHPGLSSAWQHGHVHMLCGSLMDDVDGHDWLRQLPEASHESPLRMEQGNLLFGCTCKLVLSPSLSSSSDASLNFGHQSSSHPVFVAWYGNGVLQHLLGKSLFEQPSLLQRRRSHVKLYKSWSCWV